MSEREKILRDMVRVMREGNFCNLGTEMQMGVVWAVDEIERLRVALREIAAPVYDGRTCSHCEHDFANCRQQLSTRHQHRKCPGFLAREALKS